MTSEEAKQLLKKYDANQCTEAEKSLLEDWFMSYNEHPIDIPDDRIEEIGKEIYAKLPSEAKPKTLNLFWKGLTAIAAITLLSVIAWHLFEKVFLPKETNIVKDITPGNKKATLSSADGNMLQLDGSKNGILINSDNIQYSDGSAIQAVKLSSLQTLATPNGGEYQLELSDGTKVWLNAASSLTFPTSFEGARDRTVQLTGEAYFEVQKQTSKTGKKVPFFVRTTNQTVEVLGTQFNINSYADNGQTITTLVEGSIKVGNGKLKNVLLKPGQKTIVNDNSILVQTADTETELAWKNGRLEFRDADLPTIMEQVSRWYDIKVEYKGEIPKRTFNGSISRQSNLSVLLKVLAYSDIRFEIQHNGINNTNKLIVKP